MFICTYIKLSFLYIIINNVLYNNVFYAYYGYENSSSAYF